MILHEFYFDSLAVRASLIEICRAHGLETLAIGKIGKASFAAIGKALGDGLGWVLLTYSHPDNKLINQWAADDLLFS